MIKTSTLPPSSLQTKQTSETKEESQLPEFAEPSALSINNILNYSKSLKIFKSEFVKEIEVVNT
jgi:negative regulator of genetic competence, sporulation and motility